MVVSVQIENLADLWEVDRGLRSPEQARSIVVTAQVDEREAMCFLPRPVIDHLGLRRLQDRLIRTAVGPVQCTLYSTAQLTVLGRDCRLDVCAAPFDWPVVLARIALLDLDLVVDPTGTVLIGNPAHGGERMIESF